MLIFLVIRHVKNLVVRHLDDIKGVEEEVIRASLSAPELFLPSSTAGMSAVARV
jgi:hypothetical protein